MASKAATPPYPSAARIADSPCYQQYTASLKCLEEFGSDKSKFQDHFDIYKDRKKKEREARLERNKSQSFFSWNWIGVLSWVSPTSRQTTWVVGC
ncbi:LOW QUALITY PROTEIN: cytochrome c oxidase-assembly factor COX23, mitochondrial-like [Carica papaya]|uniref:LOW QUALITY PROTEIN: cytochrome c oxidase-assembly factor COX23, mitochondrial-like n=1 Tax=Carica papaya TaxID=3649 RepID=UPI000B8C7B14|nr:LOW QUALITY PROTEIN: cytochrome c oxidase-assembly factor COX23, mitochondrial-like [Carica papaya]